MIILLLAMLAGFPPTADYPVRQNGYSTMTPAERFGVIWEYMAPNPKCGVSRTVAILASDNKIHLICGNCPTHGSHPYEEVYDPSTNSWATGLTYPGGIGVHNHSAVCIGSKIFIGGGSQGSANTDDLTVIDLTSNTWAVVGKMPNVGIPHLYYQFAAAGGKIYMFGGLRNDTIYTDETWCYDPNTNSWIRKASMPKAKMAVSAITIDDTIFVCGGSANYPNGSRTVYTYCWQTDTWTTKTDSMPVATFWASGHAVPQPGSNWAIFIIGGQNRNNFLTAVQVKMSSYSNWYSETPALTSRRSHGGTQRGCSLFVACGWNGSGIYSLERGATNLIGIDDREPSTPGNSKIPLTVTPNPFSQSTTVRFFLAEPGLITLSLYDSQGRLLKRIASCFKNKGNQTYRLSDVDLPKGVCFLVLNAQGKKVARKLIR